MRVNLWMPRSMGWLLCRNYFRPDNANVARLRDFARLVERMRFLGHARLNRLGVAAQARAPPAYRFANSRRSNAGSAASSGVSVFVVPMMRLAAAWSPARLTDSITASLPSRKPKVEKARSRD